MAVAEHNPSAVSDKNKGVLKMDHSQLHDFAKTKEKGLPEHVAKHGEHGAMDHKAEVAKMHPEHVHALVQHAASGKAGPEAQQMAQQAMQPMQGQPAEGEGPAQDSKFGQMFSGQGGGEEAAPPSRVAMFGGSR